MNKLKFILLIAGSFFISSFLFSFSVREVKNVKCMVQLINYEGEGAYIVVSILDKEGKYLETLRVLGDDEEWYPDLSSWWTYFSKNKYEIDGITGATIAGGERSVFALEIDEKFIGNGNKIRFETAVEDQKYHETDLEFELSEENLNSKLEGNGYIRYVRLFINKVSGQ